jgi:hypothetical protein
MKKYYNETTGEWYTEGQTMTRQLADGQLFVGIPTEQQLYSWGFAVYEEPEPTPEEKLAKAKAEKIAALEEYDQSSAVNSFTLGEQEMWLTRDERTQIDESIGAYQDVGATEMTKYFGGVPYTFPLTVWKQMLSALIVYASEALNTTEQHKAAINALTTVKKVKQYDFTTGYPQKLVFSINAQ